MQTMRPMVIVEKSKNFDVVSSKPPMPPSKNQVAMAPKVSSKTTFKTPVVAENSPAPIVNSKPVVMIFKKPPVPLAQIARKKNSTVNFVATSVTAKPATTTKLTWYLKN